MREVAHITRCHIWSARKAASAPTQPSSAEPRVYPVWLLDWLMGAWSAQGLMRMDGSTGPQVRRVAVTGTSTLSRQASIDITAGRVMVPNACWVSRLLAAGKAVGIYPEGTHSPHGRLHKFRTDLARLACTPARRSSRSAWSAPARCPFYESSTRAARPARGAAPPRRPRSVGNGADRQQPSRRALSLRPFGLVGATRS